MTWKQYTCEISGKHALVLVDQRFVKEAPIKEMPRLSWFGVYCKQAPGNSFWSPSETDALDAIEKDILQYCEKFGRGWAVYLLHIATAGIREYYIYHSESAEIEKAFDSTKAAHSTYRIEMESINDPQWSKYKKYALFNDR